MKHTKSCIKYEFRLYIYDIYVLEVEAEDGAVKEEEAKIEKDDVGIKIEADLEDEGRVDIQAIAGAPGIDIKSEVTE